ncbi:MAG: hypothetical protein AAB955_03125 [Patescibacteria group bacterium]
MVNLLTPRAKATLARVYYVRLTTLTLIVIAVAVGISAVLLLPTYFAVQVEVGEAERYVATLTESANQRAKSQSGQTAAIFNESIKILAAADRTAVVGPVLETILSPVPNNVSVDTLAIDRTTETVRITIGGIAATRTSLIAYIDGLKAIPHLSGVTAPVADLVAETNNPYTISATYTPPKP